MLQQVTSNEYRQVESFSGTQIAGNYIYSNSIHEAGASSEDLWVSFKRKISEWIGLEESELKKRELKTYFDFLSAYNLAFVGQKNLFQGMEGLKATFKQSAGGEIKDVVELPKASFSASATVSEEVFEFLVREYHQSLPFSLVLYRFHGLGGKVSLEVEFSLKFKISNNSTGTIDSSRFDLSNLGSMLPKLDTKLAIDGSAKAEVSAKILCLDSSKIFSNFQEIESFKSELKNQKKSMVERIADFLSSNADFYKKVEEAYQSYQSKNPLEVIVNLIKENINQVGDSVAALIRYSEFKLIFKNGYYEKATLISEFVSLGYIVEDNSNGPIPTIALKMQDSSTLELILVNSGSHISISQVKSNGRNCLMATVLHSKFGWEPIMEPGLKSIPQYLQVFSSGIAGSLNIPVIQGLSSSFESKVIENQYVDKGYVLSQYVNTEYTWITKKSLRYWGNNSNSVELRSLILKWYLDDSNSKPLAKIYPNSSGFRVGISLGAELIRKIREAPGGITDEFGISEKLKCSFNDIKYLLNIISPEYFTTELNSVYMLEIDHFFKPLTDSETSTLDGQLDIDYKFLKLGIDQLENAFDSYSASGILAQSFAENVNKFRFQKGELRLMKLEKYSSAMDESAGSSFLLDNIPLTASIVSEVETIRKFPFASVNLADGTCNYPNNFLLGGDFTQLSPFLFSSTLII